MQAAEPGREEIVVQVLLFSVLRERVGERSLKVSLPQSATTEELLDALCAAHPVIKPFRSVLRLAVNESYVAERTRLADGDEVALITPVSGG